MWSKCPIVQGANACLMVPRANNVEISHCAKSQWCTIVPKANNVVEMSYYVTN